MYLKSPPPLPATPMYTDPSGTLIRQHGTNVWEIWQQDVSQHFLITVQLEQQPPIDVIQVTEREPVSTFDRRGKSTPAVPEQTAKGRNGLG